MFLKLLLISLLILFAKAHFHYGNSLELKFNVFFLFARIPTYHHVPSNLFQYNLHSFYTMLLCDEFQLLNQLANPLIAEVPKHVKVPIDPIQQ